MKLEKLHPFVFEGFWNFCTLLHINTNTTGQKKRRDRLQSALFLRLKKFFNFAQDLFRKSSKNSFETTKGCLSCSISLGNHFFSKRKKFGFFSFGKCLIVPKTLSSPLCSQNIWFLIKAEGASLKTNWTKVA